MKKIILVSCIAIIAVLNFTLVKSKTADISLKSLTEFAQANADAEHPDYDILVNDVQIPIHTSYENGLCCIYTPCTEYFIEWGYIRSTKFYNRMSWMLNNGTWGYYILYSYTEVTNGPIKMLAGTPCNTEE